MAIPSSILAWRIAWTEEPGGLQSMRSHILAHTDLFYKKFYNIPFYRYDIIDFIISENIGYNLPLLLVTKSSNHL